MKRTQIIDLFANIKVTIVSFFSILMFVALGVGVFLGISWAAPALQTAADDTFDKGSFHNFQIQYPYGLTDDDLEKLGELESVSQVEAERQSYETIRANNRKYTVKVQSLGSSIDTPIILKGELPTKSGEIAFLAEPAMQLGVNVGDTITFEKDANAYDDTAFPNEESENADGTNSLLQRSFTITALVDSAEYLSNASNTYGFSPSPSGAIDGLAWVDDDVFDASAFEGGYSTVNVRCDSLNGLSTFSDQYKAASKEIEERISERGDTLAQKRYDELHDDVQGTIDDAQKELDDARDEIADGEKKIEDAQKDIDDGERKIADGEAEIADGEAEIANGYSKANSAEYNLEKNRQEYELEKEEGQAELDAAKAELEGPWDEYNKAAVELQVAKDENAALQAECDAALQELEAAEAGYKSAVANLQEFEEQHTAPLTPKEQEELAALQAEVTAAEQRLQDAQSVSIDVNGTPMPLEQASQAAAAGAAMISESEQELAVKKTELDVAQKKLDDAWAEFDEKVATGQEAIDDAQYQLDVVRNDVAQAESNLENAKKELDNARAELEDAKKELADKEQELNDAKAELADMEKEIEDAKRYLDQMESVSWAVFPRSYNGGASEISMFSDVTNSLSISMAALFIIVGLLVSYFAVSRIVAEQMTQSGTKKALGFRRREITTSYLWYSGIAVVAGSILGGIVAYYIVEGIIGHELAEMFIFGTYLAFVGWKLFIAIFAIELVLVLGATYLACRRILKKHAIDLLRGPEPPAPKTRFYEKWDKWEKLPLFFQTIVNNCVNDKFRVLSTIVGVAGCTALIVTAITLNNDVMKSYYRQYEEVYGFNAIAYVESEPKDAAENLESVLKSEGATTALVFEKKYILEQPNGESGSMNIVVPVDEDAFNQIYHVNPVTDGALDLSADGAWVTQAYAEHFGVKVGDVITIDDDDGAKHQVPILGFYEFWLTYHEMVVGEGYFEREFGNITPNAVLAQTGDAAFADLEAELASIEGFYSIVDDATKQKVDFDTFSSVSGSVVFIYLVLATFMAIVVLLNLNVMFIDEKKREIIVLMINGFSVKNARQYVSYDNVILTAIGIIAGLVLGCTMGSITVASVEPVTGVFVKSVDGWAVAIGILGSIVLATIMSLIALRRINRFKLVDINKF